MERTAPPERRGGLFSVWLAGAPVIVGVPTMIFGNLWIGLIVTFAGLVLLGAFAPRSWY